MDGASLAGQPRYFGYGAPQAVAGSTVSAAIATATGRILILNPATHALESTIDAQVLSYPSYGVLLSNNGTVLSAVENTASGSAVTVYALPAGTVTATFPTAGGYTALSASGTVLGLISGGSTPPCSATAQTIATAQLLWSSSVCGTSLQLSPDGTGVAFTQGSPFAAGAVTEIYSNGTLVTTIPSFALAWLGDGELLTSPYAKCCDIYSSGGMLLGTVPLQSPTTLPSAQVVPPATLTAVPTLIYSDLYNSIYSLSSSAVTWTSGSQITNDGTLGAVSGSNVVFQVQNLILAEPY